LYVGPLLKVTLEMSISPPKSIHWLLCKQFQYLKKNYHYWNWELHRGFHLEY
jgi:hypothetical protein